MNSDIHEAVHSIKDIFPVDSVYIFGSYARGSQRPGSDLDILVVFSETLEDPFELTYNIRRHLHECLDIALDVIVTSRERFKHRHQQPWTLEHVAYTEGVVI